MDWLTDKVKTISTEHVDAAKAHQNQLTKPPGALGELEELVIQLAGLQAKAFPQIKHPAIYVFAADHGVAIEGVSAFPQAVTAQMVENFNQGGAAISVMAAELEADLQVVNLGTVSKVPDHQNMQQHIIDLGTDNFCKMSAMTQGQLDDAFDVGKSIADEAVTKRVDLFIGGEMGIANTTSATALACALLGEPPDILVGNGTGINAAGLKRKINAIETGLKLHKQSLQNPIECLRCLGGFEIAALTASYIRCAQNGITIIVDGFICSVSALIALRINPDIKDWLIFSHESAEAGHEKVLSAIQAKPLLALNMRLGEASGAATALPLLKLACALHKNMATFADANVSNKTDDE